MILTAGRPIRLIGSRAAGQRIVGKGQIVAVGQPPTVPIFPPSLGGDIAPRAQFAEPVPDLTFIRRQLRCKGRLGRPGIPDLGVEKPRLQDVRETKRES